MQAIARRALAIGVGYLMLTLALHVVGPVAYSRHAVATTVALVVTYIFAFVAGYASVIRHYRPVHAASLRPPTQIAVVKVTICMGLIAAIVKLAVYTSLSSVSVASVVDALSISLNDPGSAYFDALDRAQRSGPLVWTLVLLSPVTWSAFPVSVAFFHRLGAPYRVATVLLFATEASQWILNGQNKGIFDLAIIIGAIWWIRANQRRLHLGTDTRSRRSRRGVLLIALTAGVLIIFTRAISSRTDNLEVLAIEDPGPLLAHVPSWLQPTFIALTSYLGQGYNAVSYLPSEEWHPTFGIGHSLFLTVRVDQYFGTHVANHTLQAQMASEGISPTANWHSFYVWAANDVHWLGVVPLMFLLGAWVARTVLRALVTDSASNYALLALAAIFVAYIPANAQVFQEPATFVAFWGLILYQAFSRRRGPRIGRPPRKSARYNELTFQKGRRAK